MQEYLENADDEILSTKHIQDGQSDIQQFYAGSSIFITGASGFLGKLLVEKLLRTCSHLTHIYILMREKKGKAIEERFNDLLQNVIFDKLRLEQPHFTTKISLIFGDLEQSNMSLSNSDLESIRSKIDVVFHVAATVRFDEHLRKATNINVRSTKCLLDIAKTMPKLKTFVYVSTAYSNCIHSEIEEKFYDVPITFDKLINICDSLDDSQLEKITPELIGKWPNTYSFTKAITENLIKAYGPDLPLTIVRPSVVIATENEPVPGWMNNMVGAGGLITGVVVGLIHAMYGKNKHVIDFIPADYTINTMIAAAWKRNAIKDDSTNTNSCDGTQNLENIVPIYNNVSSIENPLRFGNFMKTLSVYGNETINWLKYCFIFIIENRLAYLVAYYFTHLIPALLIDTVCICKGKKPYMVTLYKKIYKTNELLKYFMFKQWKFCNKNTQALWKRMSERDQRLFNFNIATLDWNSYLKNFTLGIRKYIYKHPDVNRARTTTKLN